MTNYRTYLIVRTVQTLILIGLWTLFLTVDLWPWLQWVTCAVAIVGTACLIAPKARVSY